MWAKFYGTCLGIPYRCACWKACKGCFTASGRVMMDSEPHKEGIGIHTTRLAVVWTPTVLRCKHGNIYIETNCAKLSMNQATAKSPLQGAPRYRWQMVITSCSWHVLLGPKHHFAPCAPPPEQQQKSQHDGKSRLLVPCSRLWGECGFPFH